MTRRLTAYFSASGHTAKAAKILAEACGSDLYEIVPKERYTRGDLNWMNPFSRSSKEMKGKLPHPELADHNCRIQDYDEIYLCFPIWWYVAPTVVNSFLEAYDFSGKKIVLFATSGSSSLGGSGDALQSSAPSAVIEDGFMLNRIRTVDAMKERLKEYHL